MRRVNPLLLTLPLVAIAPASAKKAKSTKEVSKSRPNIIVIMTDDQGYQDLGCYGSPQINTPVVDKMATEGLRLTDFYQSSSVSSASRAGLLTGRFNTRNGVPNVYFPTEGGMPSSEITIAEELKKCGYATACIGKWHLGDAPEFMPLNQGFDEFFGIPYSNDMYITPNVPLAKDIVFGFGYNLEKTQQDIATVKQGRKAAVPLRNTIPLVDGGEIVEYPTDQTAITKRLFDRAIDFVKRSKQSDTPFFTYITPTMPHVPLYASSQFKGKSKRGLYGDCVEEIDWNIGRLLETLEKEGLDENTIVIYTSDNGPWTQKKEEGGSAAPLRGGKYMVYDGGVRVPFVIRWSGVIPAGVVSDAVVTSFDLLPTFVHYAGGETPTQRLDGENISKFFEDPNNRDGLDEYVYIRRGVVRGVRKGDWVYLPYAGAQNFNKAKSQPELFNIKKDVGEKKNVIGANPEKLAELKALYESYVTESKLK